jgi:exportin-5
MIRMRWEDLTVDERRQMASMACDLLQESARPNEPWVLKSQVAALMAEVSK